MKSRRIRLPEPKRDTRSRQRVISRKRQPSPVVLMAQFEHDEDDRPTLVFRRRYPSLVFPVPAVKVPLYWFDEKMVTKKLIVSVPPDTFIVDGRRFKVLAQDRKSVGRFDYTRWLVYEEKAGKP